MKREELIEELAKIGLFACPTVHTMDMGIEYAYITSEGAGSCLGLMGEWPAFKLRGIVFEKWRELKNKIEVGIVTESDFESTDIGKMIESLYDIYGSQYVEFYDDLNVVFEGLLALPDELPACFYCMVDLRAWGEKPRFYMDENSFLADFKEEYCHDITMWDEMDDEELEEWLNWVVDSGSTFPYQYWEDDN